MPGEPVAGTAPGPVEAAAVEAESLHCSFGGGRRRVQALEDVSFRIPQREIVSIVGESGSGKTTLARVLLGLQRRDSGTLRFFGAPPAPGRLHWRRVQAVFQDPFACFNQFFPVLRQLLHGFRLVDPTPSPAEQQERLHSALRSVRMNAGDLEEKYPFELSGGQMQRLLIARVFMLRPRLLLADEPTSMIDACSRNGILQLLLDLRAAEGMTLVFITHDLGLARQVSDRIFIMRRGRIVEHGTPDQVLENPREDYTRRLVADAPTMDRDWL